MAGERADVVVVGAGTVGGWASVFAREAGAKRVLVLERETAGSGASSRAAGMVRAQGGTPDTVRLGAWSIGFYERQRARYDTDSGFVGRGYVILATTAAEERAAHERIAMQRDDRTRRLVGRRGRGAAVDPRDDRRPVPRRLLRRDRRVGRSAAQRAGVRPRDAAAPRRAPRGRRRTSVCARERASRPSRRHRRRDVRGHDRDRDGDPHRRAGDAVGRGRRGRARVGRLRAAHGRRHRALAGAARRHHGDGLRHGRRHLLAPRGGRVPVGDVEPRRGAGPGPIDRLGVPAADAATARDPRACDARPRHQEGVGGDDRVHARPPAVARAARAARRHEVGRRDDRERVRPRDDVGSRGVADRDRPRTRYGTTDVVERVEDFRMDRFDDEGNPPYVDPVALPFPVRVDD